MSSGSKSPLPPVVGRAGDWSADELGWLAPLPPTFAPPRPRLLSRPFELSRDRTALAAVFGVEVEPEDPMILSLASAYLRCFSSRSSFALRVRSSSSDSLFLRDSSSLSSSSSTLKFATPFARPPPLFASVGAPGLRERSVTGVLNSCFSGTTPCASSQWKRSGVSAESHSCFCCSWCWARRCALVSLGAGSVWVGLASAFCSDIGQLMEATLGDVQVFVHPRLPPNYRPMHRAVRLCCSSLPLLWWKAVFVEDSFSLGFVVEMAVYAVHRGI